MCFSPTASFLTAALTGSIGVIAILRVRDRREAALAAMPLLFAAQQLIEGGLWLALPTASGGAITGGPVLAFLLMAKAVWPIYAPTAMLLLETDPRRQRFMLPWLAIGLGVCAYLISGLLSHPSSARIIEDHIVYVTERREPLWVALPYIAAATFPLLLSSRRSVAAMGGVILVGAVITYGFYWHSFMSVWCFFAAAASSLILFHFEWSRRTAPAPA